MRTTEALVRGHAELRPGAVAFAGHDGPPLTYRDVDAAADRIAGGLLASGIEPGDRVAWLGRNHPDYALLHLAAERVGAVTNPLNWRLSARELSAVIADAGPGIVVVQEEFEPLLRDSLPGGSSAPVVVIRGGGAADGFRAWYGGFPAEPGGRGTREGDPTLLYYTSGTSGRAKGVLYEAGRWTKALDAYPGWEWPESPVLLIVAPVFHVAGGVWTLYGLRLGARISLVADASPAHVLGTLQKQGVTHAQLVPAMLRAVVDSGQVGAHDLSALRLVAYGSSPITPALLKAARAALGCDFVQVYGLTETCGTVCTLGADEHDEAGPHLSSAGRPVPGAEVRVVDPVDGRVLPPGGVGEVTLRMPWMMAGYWGMPDKTAEVVDADGWFRSGDAGYLDESGHLYLTDRINDMIVSGGENIYPAEVENVLAEHPAVLEAAVVGQPDERWGESVLAVVVPRPGAEPDADEVIAFCRERLAHYKCPREVKVVEALPRNASGKILRRELRGRGAAAPS
ncbi:fatty acid--CoA ligase [Actinomadura sp. KC216]|uniref:AMP-binding protein n=1 Tax=Actinomadura sp. KC216 TaxID=2530370 RepID=UPI0010538997|nr:AMP-binding protein [Actinomadura sp. KC216]TDB91422.1 fatty acid--CoA ligase [Actinomadura sp. KC216]